MLIAASLLIGCGVRGIRVDDLPTPTIRSTWQQAGITDERPAFAEIFCRQLREYRTRYGVCDEWLWLAASAPQGRSRSGSAAVPATRTLIIAPGIFGECVAPWVTPYSGDYEALRAMGYRVKVLPLEGRASSARNAELIHKHLSEPQLKLEDAVVIAYSKGVSDFMLAASQPEAAAWRDKISAFVSVAGTAHGSPAANHATKLYRKLAARVPLKQCGQSDQGGVQSLTYGDARKVAEAFAAARPPFATYSIVAVAAGTPINPTLDGFHRWLSLIDERNDGQVLLEDAVIAGSTVLGVFRADHWSIALPFEDSPSPVMRPLGFNNRFPRGALVRSILEFVAPVSASAPMQKEN